MSRDLQGLGLCINTFSEAHAINVWTVLFYLHVCDTRPQDGVISAIDIFILFRCSISIEIIGKDKDM